MDRQHPHQDSEATEAVRSAITCQGRFTTLVTAQRTRLQFLGTRVLRGGVQSFDRARTSSLGGVRIGPSVSQSQKPWIWTYRRHPLRWVLQIPPRLPLPQKGKVFQVRELGGFRASIHAYQQTAAGDECSRIERDKWSWSSQKWSSVEASGQKL